MLTFLTLEYLTTSLIVVLLPGAGVIYTLSYGLFVGGRQSIAAALGCTLGIVPHILASVCGLAALLHASAVAFQLVKFAGVLYLLYMAWGLWRSTGAVAVDAPTQGKGGARGIITRGFLLNILNPKLSMFFLAFLPQFVPTGAENGLMHMAVLSVAFMLITFVVFIGYGLAAGVLRNKVLSSAVLMKWIQRSFAAAFALFAAKLATAER